MIKFCSLFCNFLTSQSDVDFGIAHVSCLEIFSQQWVIIFYSSAWGTGEGSSFDVDLLHVSFSINHAHDERKTRCKELGLCELVL